MTRHRRHFLNQVSVTLSSLAIAQTARPWLPVQAGSVKRLRAKEFQADVVIIGGSLGGYAATLSALESGKTVILTEETDWIGGQLTSQAVPPDENPWIEKEGANQSYQDFRRSVRDFYRSHYPLTDSARGNPTLNPGNGSVSRICHEPRVALAVMTDRLARWISTGQLLVLTQHTPASVELDADRIRAVVVRDSLSGDLRTLHAHVFIDATELGELAELGSIEHVTGFESQAETAEPLAPEKAQPENQQAFTICFALEHHPGMDHTIEKPAEYEFWRDYVPALNPAWSGKLLSLTYCNPKTLEPRTLGFDPEHPEQPGWWKYRRIIDAANFAKGSYPASGITLANWPQNDYLLGNLAGPGVTKKTIEQHVTRARQLSLSLVHWLQTEVTRPDGGQGWPGLKTRGDLLGTHDGLAKYPYIRESRRLRTKFTVTTQHVGTDDRKNSQAKNAEPVRAEQFMDSVGIGAYRIDLHPSTGGDNYIDISSLPFQIPLGSLIPVRIRNLIPACKNIGVTHLTNGCYRLHPVEWAIGEAAGVLAAHACDLTSDVQMIYEQKKVQNDYLKTLENRGVRRVWTESRPL